MNEHLATTMLWIWSDLIKSANSAQARVEAGGNLSVPWSEIDAMCCEVPVLWMPLLVFKAYWSLPARVRRVLWIIEAFCDRVVRIK